MTVKSPVPIIFVIAITFLLVSFPLASDWKYNPGMFNPSGVPSVSFTQPRFADLDADGDLDMILGSTAGKPVYLNNTGTVTSPKFTLYDDIFTTITGSDAEVAVAYDMDADGDLDLITGGFNSLLYFENTGNAVYPEFTKVPGFFSSVIAGGYPIPDMGDIDNDGDLDMVIGYSESGAVRLYTNTGSDTLAVFTEASSQDLGDVGLYAYPVFCDPDNDNDLDILCGRDGHYFTYYKNVGSAASGNWQADAAVYSGLGANTYFNSPAMADINGDGKQDLIYGNYNGPLTYYRNTGTSSAPAWTVNTTLFGGVIDAGGASAPFFFDKDNDGDLDMYTGSQMGDIKFYENTGTAYAAVFNYTTSYAALKHSIYSSVSIAEVNGDGLPDALVGDLNGGIYYHMGSGEGFISAASAPSLGNVGGWSAPRFVDLDRDGDQDIVTGNEDGYLAYYENQGTSTEPVWSDIFNYFDSLDVGYDCVPAFADLDFDGDYDMLTPGRFRTLRYFENVGGTWVEDTTMVEGIEDIKQNVTPAFADLDGDGDQDLILGNYDGTFDYYENLREVVAVDPLTDLPASFELNAYPNPFNPQTAISFDLPVDSKVELSIFDLTGRKIETLLNGYKRARKYTVNFNAGNLSSGVYLYRLTVGNVSITNKLVLMK